MQWYISKIVRKPKSEESVFKSEEKQSICANNKD